MKALVATAAALFATLMLATVWFMLRPDPLGGEPYAELKIPLKRPRAAPVAAGGRLGGQLADGHLGEAGGDDKAAAQQAGRAAGPQPTVPPSGVQTNTAETNPNYPGVKVIGLGPRPAADGAPGRDGAMPSPIGGEIAPGPATMARVPVKALVEYTRYGPLPKISEDGRAPKFVYARPHKFPPRSAQGQPARIAILVNGLGLSSIATHTAIEKLPAAVTLAFEPYGSNLQGWVRKARQRGHEVILQVPLEPFDYPDNDPGPHTMLTSLPPSENVNRLKWLMARFTGYMGVTNTMGAKFTASREALRPILQEIKKRGLVYVDDGSSPRSNARKLAEETGVEFVSGQVAIDAEQTRTDIRTSLAKLETIAQERGLAIGVGSTLPVTLEEISEWAEKLSGKNIDLIPISAAIRIRRPVNRS